MNWNWSFVVFRGICIGLLLIGLNIRGARAWAMAFGLIMAIALLDGSV